MPSILSTTANVFTLDLSQASYSALSAASAANVSGDSYQINLPGKQGAASVIIANANVAATVGSTVITITVSAANSALINPGISQSIDVIMTRATITYGFQFNQVLNVFPQANP